MPINIDTLKNLMSLCNNLLHDIVNNSREDLYLGR